MKKATVYDTTPLSDSLRKIFADRKISVPNTIWKRRYISVAINDVLALTIDTRRNIIVGLLDADKVDVANTLPCSVRTEHGNGYRIDVLGASRGISSSIGLSVAVLCYHDGFFSASEGDVHHIENSCDNRRAFLKKVNTFDKHPPKIQDSQKHICNVLAQYGLTYQDALAKATKKIKNKTIY